MGGDQSMIDLTNHERNYLRDRYPNNDQIGEAIELIEYGRPYKKLAPGTLGTRPWKRSNLQRIINELTKQSNEHV